MKKNQKTILWIVIAVVAVLLVGLIVWLMSRSNDRKQIFNACKKNCVKQGKECNDVCNCITDTAIDFFGMENAKKMIDGTYIPNPQDLDKYVALASKCGKA